MNIYSISAAILVLLAVIVYYGKRNYMQSAGEDPTNHDENGEMTPEQLAKHNDPDSQVCCGAHTVCEKQRIVEAVMSEARYFEDEHLDKYRGRASDSYDDEEIEEFRYVLYTTRQNEVREWMECLIAREIELPDELKEEAYAMLGENEMLSGSNA